MKNISYLKRKQKNIILNIISTIKVIILDKIRKINSYIKK